MLLFFDKCRESGLLNTRLVLNFDLSTVEQFAVLNISVNDTQFVDHIIVNIEIVDINDESPEFMNDSYRFVLLYVVF